ncbi:MAG: hypothetical protein OXB84_03470, partial [Halobacteriovoraceae bacterium]|nr:hypothetical protein [Halobacteriovoraceae bacterium]
FMTDWRTALAKRKGEIDFNDVFVNSVDYNSPVEDSDPVFLISRLRQARDFLIHGLGVLTDKGQNLIRKEKIVTLFTEKSVWPGYSGGPLWCYSEDNGLVYRGLVSSGPFIGNLVTIKTIDPKLAQWIQDNNHGID